MRLHGWALGAALLAAALTGAGVVLATVLVLTGDGDVGGGGVATPQDTAAPTTTPTRTPPADNEGSQPPEADDDPLAGLLESLGGEVPGAACLAPGDGGAGLFGQRGGGEPAPSEPAALVDHIAAEVAELRELTFTADVDATFLDSEAVAARIEELLAEDYPPAEIDTDARLLTALGAVPRGTDLGAVVTELLGDQVAGFYVPGTDELVVRTADGAGLSAADRIILAHELVHALTDQVHGLPDDVDTGHPDADLALLAVIEGDASLLMNQWSLGNLSLTEQLSLVGDPALLASERSLDAAPHYLAEELTFPYLDGLDFTCEVWRRGGWDAVDALYDAPPASSAQVLFPERFFAGEQPVGAPELPPPPGYDERATESFGAAPLVWLFEAPGGDTDAALDGPEDRAAGWAGGRVAIWGDGGRTAVGLSLVDGGEGSVTLCESMTAWYAAAFPDAVRAGDTGAATFDGSAQDAAVACDGDHVALAVAPDLETATAITSG